MSEAVSKSPSSAAQTMARESAPATTLETTEMTPRAPSAMAGAARSSLPAPDEEVPGALPADSGDLPNVRRGLLDANYIGQGGERLVDGYRNVQSCASGHVVEHHRDMSPPGQWLHSPGRAHPPLPCCGRGLTTGGPSAPPSPPPPGSALRHGRCRWSRSRRERPCSPEWPPREIRKSSVCFSPSDRAADPPVVPPDRQAHRFPPVPGGGSAAAAWGY